MPLRAAPLVLSLLLAAAIAGCGGAGGSTKEPTPAQRLAAPGSKWASLSDKDQVLAVRSCRLDAAVSAAKMGGVRFAPYFSGRYNAIAGLDGAALHQELTGWFRGHRHTDQTIGQACRAVLRTQVDLARIQGRARADFATPVTASARALRLNLFGDHVTLRARVSPGNARLAVTPAPQRARSTADIAVRQSGDRADVRLTHVPLGLSYLRVVVRDRAGRPWERLLVVRRGPTQKRPAPRTFAPLVISGQGSRGLPILYLPQQALATVSTQGAPLSLTSGGTVILAHGLSDRDHRIRIDAGRYRNVQVTATGEWTIRIVPAPRG